MWRRLLVITGLAALVAYVLRRRPPAKPCVEGHLESFVDDPSDELRRRLDEARRREEDAQVGTTSEPPAAPRDLEQLRHDVHERARAAAEEMRSEPE